MGSLTVRVDLRTRVLRTLAGQLGHPQGPVGRVVGRLLNRGNRERIRSAVEALGAGPGMAVADIGFGGGVGLDLLLERLGGSGRVHGVDASATMVSGASRRLRRQIDAGLLEVHTGSIEALPLADAGVDGVMTVNTLYFVADLPRALAECARVLKPGATLAVGIGDPAAMARLPFTPHGFRLRPVPVVTAALTEAGLALREDRRVGEGDDAYHVLVATKPVQT